MGVKGLWKLIEEAGTPVPLESLELKILAVDVSIWLHQAVRGFKGIGGETVANSHLLTLFHRICKLLFYRIKPVFVFDGGVPHLKKQTLTFRRMKREVAASRAQQVRERLLTNLLKSHAVRNALGKTGPGPAEHKVLPPPKPKQKDMFELPPLPDGVTLEPDVKAEESDNSETEDHQPMRKKQKSLYTNLHNFDLDSEEFKSLPLQNRHEILVELQYSRKDNSWSTINQMPSESTQFSSYQMGRLLKRWKFQETVDNVRTAIQVIKSDELEKELFGDLEKHVSQTHKIASEDNAHSVIISRKKEEPPPAPVPVKVDKGKSPMKKPRKDFLEELSKEGFMKESPYYANSDYDSDDSEDSNGDKPSCISETDPLIHVMQYVMDDINGLTQDEILGVIQQTRNEVDHSLSKFDSEASTSRNASGVVGFNDSISDSDDQDDDFIEVPEENIPSGTPEIALVEDTNENINAIRASNSNSLYIKIVQHRLNDIIQKTKTSPKKALLDTRIRKEHLTTASKKIVPLNSAVKRKSVDNTVSDSGITLSINLNNKSPVQDDLFADIFSTVKPVLKGTSNSSLPTNDISNNIVKTKSLNIPVGQEDGPINVVRTQATNVLNSPISEEPTSNGKIDISTNMQDRINELVRLQVEEMLKNSSLPDTQSQIPADIGGDDNSKGNDATPESDDNSEDDDEDWFEVDNSNVIEDTTAGVDATPLPATHDNNAGISSRLSTDVVQDSGITSSKCDKLSSNEALIGVTESSSVDETSTDPSHGKVFEVPSDSENIVQQTRDSPTLPAPSIDELKILEGDLASENQNLVAQAHKVERVASNLSQQMYTDAQDLLQLFGIPYLVAPMEAEAQCAFLDDVGLTNGTITDDSDAFLFGSKHVYKNFFNQSQHVELFKLPNVQHKFGLDREKLITLALLTGSDYTEGIEGIGAVSGMEILSEFPGQGVDILKNFKRWWTSHTKGVSVTRMSKIRGKLGKVFLPESFPNEAIYNAYIDPTIDDSREQFCWSVPNVDALREFSAEKLGWSKSKTDEILMPVIKRMNLGSSQTKIDSFFNNIRLVKEPKTTSKRLREAIAKSKGEIIPTSSPTKGKNFIEQIKQQEAMKSTTKVAAKAKQASVLLPAAISQPKKQTRGRQKKNSSIATSPTTSTVSPVDADDDVVPMKELTKEEKILRNYQKLLQKEEIAQRTAAEEDMKLKKQNAALLLQHKMKSRGRK